MKGMAGNTAANIKCNCSLKAYVAEDTSINKKLLKTRFIEEKSNHMFLRVDKGDTL